MYRRRRRSALPALIAATLALLPPAMLLPPWRALAQTEAADRAKANRAITRGIAHLRAGAYDDALAELLEAHALDRSPKTTALVAQAQQALRRWVDAERNYNDALAAADDPWMQKNRGAIEKKLSEVRARLGTVEVKSAQRPPGEAEIRVNGELVGFLPMTRPVRVPAGPVTVNVKGTTFEPFARTIDVAPGAVVKVDVRLTPLVDPSQPAFPDALAAPAPPADVPPPAAGEGWPKTRWWGLALLAGGAGTVGLGAYLLSIDGRLKCPAPPTMCAETTTGTGGYIALGGGILAASGGVILMLHEPPSTVGAPSVSAGIGPGGIVLSGTW